MKIPKVALVLFLVSFLLLIGVLFAADREIHEWQETAEMCLTDYKDTLVSMEECADTLNVCIHGGSI